MALNPQYEEIGKGFVTQYYAMFDDPLQRPNLVNLYNVSRRFRFRVGKLGSETLYEVEISG